MKQPGMATVFGDRRSVLEPLAYAFPGRARRDCEFYGASKLEPFGRPPRLFEPSLLNQTLEINGLYRRAAK